MAMNPLKQAAEQPQAAPPQQAAKVDPKLVALVELVASRTMQALAQVGPDLDAALKADPVDAAVKFGTQALRQVVMAAMQAGKELPFDAIVNAGMVVIKELAAIANDKGYLPDEQIETFLKEVFQQSLAEYTRLDMKDGMLTQGDMQAMQEKMGMGRPAAPKGALAQQAQGA
jgi:hypothetical protein